MRYLLVIVLLTLSGCGVFRKAGIIKSSTGASVLGVPDAGKPATLNESTGKEQATIPAGSSIVITKHEAIPYRAPTEKTPEFIGAPAFETTEIKLSKDTPWVKNTTTVDANTGTIDQSVALHRIDVESKKPFLYGSIIAVCAAIAFMLAKYPTPALMCGIAAVLLFLLWKVADMPSWLAYIGVGLPFAAYFLFHGYEKREKEAKANSALITNAQLSNAFPPPTPVVVVPPAVNAS